jgi:hypothetical protein
VYIGGPREEDVLAGLGITARGGQVAVAEPVALDKQGHVYVSDEWGNRIAIFDANGNSRVSGGRLAPGRGTQRTHRPGI